MKKKMIVTLTLCLLLSILLAIATTACNPKEPETTSSEPKTTSSTPHASGDTLVATGKKLAYITPTGGLGDGAIGDACYEGILEAQAKLGFDLSYSEPMTQPDYEELIIEYAESGEYDIIFCAGNEAMDPVNSVGSDYPNQKFIVYDIQAEGNEQYVSQYFAKNEIGFIAGALAALVEEHGEVSFGGKPTKLDSKGLVGLIMGVEAPSTVNALTGAAAGVKYINPEYQYLYGIVGEWKDQAKNKELALSMYDQGVNMIFQNSGGGALGIIAAAQERDRFFIGYDADQSAWDPERVIGSSMKMNTDAIVRVISQFFETGTLPWGEAEENNAANGGINFQFNPNYDVPDEIQGSLNKVIDQLRSGAIKAPNTWEEVDMFSEVFEP